MNNDFRVLKNDVNRLKNDVNRLEGNFGNFQNHDFRALGNDVKNIQREMDQKHLEAKITAQTNQQNIMKAIDGLKNVVEEKIVPKVEKTTKTSLPRILSQHERQSQAITRLTERIGQMRCSKQIGAIAITLASFFLTVILAIIASRSLND